MKGYIYSMYAGADPGRGWTMTDPIFGKVPTLGACMPNIRRLVEKGDHIFVISGRVPGVQQYVVGGFQVSEKIDALTAYHRFPGNRMHDAGDGSTRGNIITDAAGQQVAIDYHSNFAERVKNYVVGRRQKAILDESVERARRETLPILSEVFEKKGGSVSEVIGRWRRLDQNQIESLRGWIDEMNRR
jgi:hypothetical protein